MKTFSCADRWILIALGALVATSGSALGATRQEIMRQSGERAQRQKPASYTPSTKLRAEGARENYERRQAASSSSRRDSGHSSSRSHSSNSGSKSRYRDRDDDDRDDDRYHGDHRDYSSHSRYYGRSGRYYGYPRSYGYYSGYRHSPFFAAPVFSAFYSSSSYYEPYSGGSTLYYRDEPPPVGVYRGRISASPDSGAAYDQYVAVQRALSERGYDVGGIDGIAGPRTRAAIRQFQVDAGLTPTGTVNTAVLKGLGLL